MPYEPRSVFRQSLTGSRALGLSLPLKPDQLPFLKRYPYQDEREFRLLYQSKMETLPTFDVSISLDCIEPNNTESLDRYSSGR